MAISPIIQSILLDIQSKANLNALKQTKEVLQQLAKVGVIGAKGAITAVNKQMKKVATTSKDAARQLRPFRMELLGVMFGAQMVSSAFIGLLKPAFETVGIFDIWGTMLSVFFLPTAEMLLDWIVRFFDFVMLLPEPVRELLGNLLLTVGAFFSFLATKAAFDLFMDSWVKHVGKLNTQMKVFAGFFGATYIIKAVMEADTASWQTTLSDALFGMGFVLLATSKGNVWTASALIVVSLAIKFRIFDKFLDFIEQIYQTIQEIGKLTFGRARSNMLRAKAALAAATGEYGYMDTIMRTGGPRQAGGFIPFTGLYKLHRGETVIPSEQNLSFSPTINIMGGSGMDARAVANIIKMELNQQWASELGRLARR